MTEVALSHKSILILSELLEKDIICLTPPNWAAFYPKYKRILARRGIEDELPPPMILGAWWDYNDLQKNIRFLEQLAVLKKYQLMNDCLEQLVGMPSNVWYRSETLHHSTILKEQHELWSKFESFFSIK